MVMMLTPRTILCAVVGLTVSLWFPATTWAIDPNPEGELVVHVVASATPDYIEEWVLTQHDHPVHIKRLREVIPEQTFYVAVIVT